MSAHPISWLTPEQYLEIERGNDFRSEYYDGRMYAMSGGTAAHAFIISNFTSELRQALKKSSCSVASSELRVRVPATGLYTYPDIAVICGDLEFVDNKRDTITNPKLIVEVLSRTTEAYNRGRKFVQYQKLESLQEYVLVAQTQPLVEIFARQPDGQWLKTEYSGMESSCVCASVGCTIPLAEIYDKVVLRPEAE